MTAPERQEPATRVELRAWATDQALVHQAGGSMLVVHGGVNRHEHYHSGAEEDVRTTGPAAGDVSPYPGLRAFGREDAEWFFGREVLVGRIISRLDRCLTEGGPLAVVAPSGAGKSSLLRAGVLPGLSEGRLPGSRDWPQLLLTPTRDPLARLASGLAKLTGADEPEVAAAMAGAPGRLSTLVRERLGLAPGGRIVLVVDQVEELFTLCEGDAVRRRFVAALAGLTEGGPREGGPRDGGSSDDGDGQEQPVALAVYGLRADVYGPCAAFPHLRDALVNRQVIVGPMSDDEVRRAVTKPAERSRLRLAPGLVDVILRDLRGTARQADGSYEVGRLPLLAHALRTTWLQRGGDTLTVTGYRDTGGIDGAMEATAEEEFGKLDRGAGQAARQLFLSLVRVGENGELTRRRRTRGDLLLATNDPRAVPGLVERFTHARLLTQGVEQGAEREEGTVEVTHEALLWAWPRLRTWIAAAGGSGVPVRQELEEAALAWERDARKDSSHLYRGARLELARSWAARDEHGDLTSLITEFLAASQRHRRRTRVLRRGAVAAITVLALLASGLSVFAFDRSREALEQRDNAIFDRVTAEADRQRPTDAALAAQLDLVAYRMRPTADLRTRLTTEAVAVLPTPVPGDFGSSPSAAFGPRGRLVTGASGIRLWDASDPARPVPLSASSRVKGVTGPRVVHSPRGDLVAVSGANGGLTILDVSDPRHPVALSRATPVPGASVRTAFSADGRLLAVVASSTAQDQSDRATVQLWSTADPRRPRRLSTVLSLQGRPAWSAAFSPDGGTLVVGGGGNSPGSGAGSLLRMWDVSDPARPRALGGELSGHESVVNQVAYSPAGKVMASAGSDNKVLVWDVSDPRRPKVVVRLFFNSTAQALAFSRDGRLLATGESSGSVNLWNIGDPRQTRTIALPLTGHSTVITDLSFDSTGRTLASGAGDGKVLLWRLPSALTVLAGGASVGKLAVTDDGRLLAAASGAKVTLWDVSDPNGLTHLGTLPRLDGTVNALAFRPTMPAGAAGSAGSAGPVLATGAGSTAQLWDLSAPSRPIRIGKPLPGQTRPVGALAFDTAGSTLLAGTLDLTNGISGGVRAWDVSEPDRPAPLGDGDLPGPNTSVSNVVAAHAGGYVYSSAPTGTFRVWRTGAGAVPSAAGEVFTGQVIFSLAAARQTRLVATGGADSRVKLWDTSRPKKAPALVGKPLLSGGIVTSVGFAPDDGMLAGGNATGQIVLWDATDPAHATAYGRPLTGHSGMVEALLFNPLGGSLITSGSDGTVRLWQTDPAHARTILCASTRTAMTPARWKKYVSRDLPYTPPCAT